MTRPEYERMRRRAKRKKNETKHQIIEKTKSAFVAIRSFWNIRRWRPFLLIFLNCYYYYWLSLGYFFLVGRSSTVCEIVVFFNFDARCHRNVLTSSLSWSSCYGVLSVVHASEQAYEYFYGFVHILIAGRVFLSISISNKFQLHVVRCPFRQFCHSECTAIGAVEMGQTTINAMAVEQNV